MITKCSYYIVLLFLINSHISINAQAMDVHKDIILECKLKAAVEQSFKRGTWITYSLTNTSNTPIKLLPWYTPLEGFMSDLFYITDNNGHALTYQGPMFKRQHPMYSDYIQISPQETLSAKLNLQHAYNLHVTHYKVTLLNKRLLLIDEQNNTNSTTCIGNTIEIKITE